MSGQLRIAHLIATNFYGGPEKQIVEHAIRLDSARYPFSLISFVENGSANELITRAAEMKILNRELHTSGSFHPQVIGRLAAILRSDEIGLLVAHGYKSNVIGRLASWKAGIPMIAVSRGWTSENWKIGIYQALDKVFLHLADHVVAVSDGQAARIARLHVAQNKVTVIRNSVSESAPAQAVTHDLKRELGVPSDACLVVSAGRLSPEKNFASMIEAAHIATSAKENLYFAVFGEGQLRQQLESMIARLNLRNRFFLPGFRKDFSSLVQGADIFLLPSFTEGLPNVILEAFAARRPVVATAVGGTPEIVEDGVSGYLLRPHEVQKMADYVIRLADSPELRELMGLKGFERVQEHFTFERQTAQYEDLYGRFTFAKR